MRFGEAASRLPLWILNRSRRLKLQFKHEEIAKGGELIFEMSERPFAAEAE